MSNLNSAFIKVYKKSDEKKSKAEGIAPHFTLDGKSSEASPDVVSYRIDTGSEGQANLRPWLTSISTVDIETFQAAPMVEIPKQVVAPPRHASNVASNAVSSSKIEAATRVIETRERLRFDVPSPSQAMDVRDWTTSALDRAEPVEEARVAPLQEPSKPEPPIREPALRNDVVRNHQPRNDLLRNDRAIGRMVEEDPIPSMERTLETLENAVKAESTFHAVWEVDSFQWPKTVDDLFQYDSSLSSEIGRHLRQANRRGLKVLAVTSAAARHGRTTVACCLAKAAARMGLRVALVDGDLHHPQLADQLNLEVVSDWQAIASGSMPLEEAAIHSIEDRITLIPLQTRPNAAPLAPDHVKVQGILRRLASSFDLVVVDSQHLGHPTGRLMGCGIHSPIDAAILVVDASYPQESSVADSLRMLARIGIDSVGIVENFR